MKKQPNIRHMDSRAVFGYALSSSSSLTVVFPSGWVTMSSLMTGWKGLSSESFRCS